MAFDLGGRAQSRLCAAGVLSLSPCLSKCHPWKNSPANRRRAIEAGLILWQFTMSCFANPTFSPHFYKLKVRGNPELNDPVGARFPAAFAHSASLVFSGKMLRRSSHQQRTMGNRT